MKQQPSNAEIYTAINDLRQELVARDEQLEEKVDQTYLRIVVFEAIVEPLKRFVYGLIALAGAGFITALMGVLLK